MNAHLIHVRTKVPARSKPRCHKDLDALVSEGLMAIRASVSII